MLRAHNLNTVQGLDPIPSKRVEIRQGVAEKLPFLTASYDIGNFRLLI